MEDRQGHDRSFALELLHEAATNNDPEGVRNAILAEGADVNGCKESSNSQRSALHLAAEKGHEEIVDVLIEEFGAKINQCDCAGQTPLHLMATASHVALIRKLCRTYQARKYIDYCDDQGNTPLHLAAEKGNVEAC